MTNFISIPNADVAVGAPVDTALMTALRDNALAVGENDPSVPDAARLSLFLGELSPTSGTTTVLSGVDLSLFRQVTMVIKNMATFSGAVVSVNGTTIFSSAPTINSRDGLVLFDLEDGVCYGRWGTFTVTPTTTGLVNASTSITIVSTNGYSRGTDGGFRFYAHK